MKKKHYLILSCLVIILVTIYSSIHVHSHSTNTIPKRVLFIVHTNTVGGKGVFEMYKAMKNVGHDVKIAMIPLFYDGTKLQEEPDFEFARNFDTGDIIFPCGTQEPYTCHDIEYLKPDYIFTQMPYNPYMDSPLYPYFTNEHLKKICHKLALVVYGPHIFHQLGMNNTYLSKLIDIIFVDSDVSKKIYVDWFNFKSKNVVVAGYQPYKSIRDIINHNVKKEKHGETVLWLPRWQLSFKDRKLYEGGSTFLNYHYYFYNYFLLNPSKHLIIRPHYGLFLLRSKFLTHDDLTGILDKFQKLNNVTISYHQISSLTDDIVKADIIISDGSSALAEAVIANKPIIYLSNGWNNEFNSNKLSQELKKHIYIAYDPLDIEKYLEIIRANGYTVQYDKKFKKMLDPIENPALFIAKYILYNH